MCFKECRENSKEKMSEQKMADSLKLSNKHTFDSCWSWGLYLLMLCFAQPSSPSGVIIPPVWLMGNIF